MIILCTVDAMNMGSFPKRVRKEIINTEYFELVQLILGVRLNTSRKRMIEHYATRMVCFRFYVWHVINWVHSLYYSALSAPDYIYTKINKFEIIMPMVCSWAKELMRPIDLMYFLFWAFDQNCLQKFYYNKFSLIVALLFIQYTWTKFTSRYTCRIILPWYVSDSIFAM